MKLSAMPVLWVLATTATTAVAFWAVSAAGSSVNEQPLAVVVAGSTSRILSTTTIASASVTLATTTSGASVTGPVVTGTSAAWNRTTLNSGGGSIIVSYRPTEVRLDSVAPLAGYTFEIDDDGPDRVRVEFFGEGITHTLRAEWTDQGLATEIDSTGGADDDDD